jgi:hypothetical protein
MSVQARVNSLFGGSEVTPSIAATASGTIAIPPFATFINLTNSTGGSVTLSSTIFSMPSFSRGRVLIFQNNSAQNIVFPNTATPAVGQMVSGANVTLGQNDILAVFIRQDGSAVRLWSTDN